ncbi:MAG TPA: GNAT family N-acetyltransferase [Allosphingosinicella sp.]|nr:GNAT family N-acetyltransferase [Allosphingosinicella sp.]
MIAYRNAKPDDAAAIDELFRRTFTDTFAHLYDPEDLAAFFAGFTEAGWRREIADPGFAFRLAEDGAALAGYAKMGPVSLPVEPPGPAAELRQLYVLQPWHGTGIARELMDWVLAEARRRDAGDLYLSVFIENHRAQKFYARYGFEAVGRYDFMVGRQADHDLLMRARL